MVDLSIAMMLVYQRVIGLIWTRKPVADCFCINSSDLMAVRPVFRLVNDDMSANQIASFMTDDQPVLIFSNCSAFIIVK